MRSRPSFPDRLARSLRETPTPSVPPGLLDRLVAPTARPVRTKAPLGGLAVATALALAVFAVRQLGAVPSTAVRLAVAPRASGPSAELPSAPAKRGATKAAKRTATLPAIRPAVRREAVFSTRVAVAKHPAPIDDLAYLNAREATAPFSSGRAAGTDLPPMRDDFVAPPELRLASTATPEADARLAREAMERYRQETKVVDARLVRNVTLAVKHASMDEVCAEIARQTGVSIVAGRNVRDENATIFTKPRPAREVMREIGRVFGFVWEREGEEGEYRYRLTQDTAAQIAEERTRNDDVAQAIGTLTGRVRHGRSGPATTEDFCRQAFAELLPDELARLRAGEPVAVGAQAPSGASELEPEVTAGLLGTMGGVVHNADGTVSPVGFNVAMPSNATPYSKMADATVGVTFRMRITEFGGARLGADVTVNGGGMGLMNEVSLGDARGVAEAPVDNARANAALRAEAAMTSPVVLAPRPTTPLAEQGADPGPLAENTIATMFAGYRTVEGLKPPRPFMTSDDVWQAVHEATGRDVIADSFSRLFKLKTYRGTLFDALGQAGDALHQRWGEDAGWITARSRAYVWQRTNEVPKARLLRWAKIQQDRGALPLETILEMSLMSDRQLDSVEVGRTIANQWGLMGWGIPSRPMWTAPLEPIRPLCRFLASLPPDQYDAMLKHALPAGKVPAESLVRIGKVVGVNVSPDTLLGVDYVPAGRYFWLPFFEQGKETPHDDLILGSTAEAVEAEVHRRYPDRPRGEAAFSDGRLTLTIQKENVTLREGDVRYEIGHRVP